MIKGSRWFRERPQGVTGERGKTGAEEGKACPQAANGRKPSAWGSRDDFQGQVCFFSFCLKVIQKRTETPGRGSGTPRSDTATPIEGTRNKTQGSSSFPHFFFFFSPPSSLYLGLNTNDGLSGSSPNTSWVVGIPGGIIPSPGGVPVCTRPVSTVHASRCYGVFLVRVISRGAGC